MTNSYLDLILFLKVNLIRVLFVSVLIIIMVKGLVVNKRYAANNAIQIVRYILLSYTLIILFQFFCELFTNLENSNFARRATGSYKALYFFMLFASLILPFSLLYKRLGKNAYYVLFVSLMLNSAWLFELWAIHITSLHRDFAPQTSKAYFDIFAPMYIEIVVLLKGLLVGVILLVIGNWLAKRKEPSTTKI